MSELQDLVPPLSLCKQIPAGAFADSALVWIDEALDFPLVEPRGYAPEEFEECPAPTMAEILEALKAGDHNPSCYLRGDTIWVVDGVGACKKGHKFPPAYDAVDLNPAAAALKLWLELEARK